MIQHILDGTKVRLPRSRSLAPVKPVVTKMSSKKVTTNKPNKLNTPTKKVEKPKLLTVERYKLLGVRLNGLRTEIRDICEGLLYGKDVGLTSRASQPMPPLIVEAVEAELTLAFSELNDGLYRLGLCWKQDYPGQPLPKEFENRSLEPN